MVANETISKFGYFPETNANIRILNGSIWRKFGHDLNPYPKPLSKAEIIKTFDYSSYAPNSTNYGNRIVDFSHEYGLVDPRELYYVLGNNTTAGTGTYAAPKTHTMTPTEPTDAFELPARTIHQEIAGLTTPKQIDIPGCYTVQMDLTWQIGDSKGIVVKEQFQGQRYVDEAATTNLYGDTVASGGTSDPEGSDGYTASRPDDFSGTASLPDLRGYPTAGQAFQLKTSNGITVGGVDITSQIARITISLVNVLTKDDYVRSGTNNYGVDISYYRPRSYIKERNYAILFECKPNDSITDLWSTIESGTHKQVIVDFGREDNDGSTKVNDIKFTFHATASPLVNLESTGYFKFADPKYDRYAYQPKDLVSCVSTSGATGVGLKYIGTLLSDDYVTN
jgi:hypothetical protein